MKIGATGLGITCLFLFGLAFQIEAFPPEDAIYCRVVYAFTTPDGSTEYNGDEVLVKISELPVLSKNPSVKALAVSASPISVADYQGTLRDETDKEVITYTGHFRATKAMEHFLPHKTPIILRPENWMPAGKKNGSPEIYTTENHEGLRAAWMRAPVYGSSIPPLEQRYFAVSVQLNDYLFKPVSCIFTGTRIVKAKSPLGKNSTENLTDTEVKFVNVPDREISVYPQISAIHM